MCSTLYSTTHQLCVRAVPDGGASAFSSTATIISLRCELLIRKKEKKIYVRYK